jgi:glucosamine--fructose-6-phosphate aminotransferase (isomerizing)
MEAIIAMSGVHTLHEIQAQPGTWAAVLGAVREQAQPWQEFFAQGKDGLTIFFGCGSTYYLSLTAASVLQSLAGQLARGVPASELYLFPETCIPTTCACATRTRSAAEGAGAGNYMVNGIAISRSGTTTEALRAADHLAQRYCARVAAVTCYNDTSLAERCSPILVSPEGHEKSIAQTRSFSSMLVGCQALAGLAGERPDYVERLSVLSSAGERLMQRNEPLARSLGQDLSIAQVFFLGSGPRYGLACEAMLKLKEMSLTISEAYHFLEFRHGPKSMVDGRTLVVGLLSDAAREAEVAVLREVKELGARVLILAEAGDGLTWADHLVCLESGLPELARLPLYLPVPQLFAYHRAVGKGLDPDAPRHLDAAVHL